MQLRLLLRVCLGALLGAPLLPAQAPSAMAETSPAPLSGRLVSAWDGPGSRAHKALMQRFRQLHRVKSEGSFGAVSRRVINDFLAGALHIGFVGGDLTSEQRAVFERRFGFAPVSRLVACDPIVIFVNAKNPIRGLSPGHVTGIFAEAKGAVLPVLETWGDVGATGDWRERPLQPAVDVGYAMEEVRAEILGSGLWKPTLRRADSSFRALDYVGSEVGGLSIGRLSQRRPDLRAIGLMTPSGEIAEPTAELCRNGWYPWPGGIFLHVAFNPRRPDPLVAAFLEFVESPEGQRALAESNLLPAQPPGAPPEQPAPSEAPTTSR